MTYPLQAVKERFGNFYYHVPKRKKKKFLPTNKYTAKCHTCKTLIPRRLGHLKFDPINKRWNVFCQRCNSRRPKLVNGGEAISSKGKGVSRSCRHDDAQPKAGTAIDQTGLDPLTGCSEATA